MIQKRNLDDQTYQSIVDAAIGRIPWLCPDWTDHNSHDPGVTVLELMAWYKEMQQYQMNQVTPALKEKLLKIAGVRRRPASPARCALTLPDEGAAYLPLTRLETPEGIPFELLEEIPGKRPHIGRVQVAGVELWDDMVRTGSLTFQPFAFGGRGDSTLRIAVDTAAQPELRLWFQVEEPPGVPRTPFARPEQQPRALRWSLEGYGQAEPLRDETHSLSQSGCVTFAVPEEWPADEAGLRWIQVQQTDPGCEETVRLSGLSAARWSAVQQETRARSHSFAAPPEECWQGTVRDAMARSSVLAVFLRTGDGWVQTANYTPTRSADGLTVTLDARTAAQDGGDNVTVVCLDAKHQDDLLFDASGLPNESLYLNLGGGYVLSEDFTLWCETLDLDGQVRLLPWRCVDDLLTCGPRDHAFVYDPLRETITFGDGEHGAVVRRGRGAILVTNMTLSLCAGGNIPAQAGLRFTEDGAAADNSAAAGGVDRESVSEAAARFLRSLGDTEKCACAADYERLAKTTPGLRVAAAKALPGYDPAEPAGISRTPTVTVVVVPASGQARPVPDERFVAEVQHRLEQRRPVCTKVQVAPPVYEDVYVSLSLKTRDGVTREKICALLERYLSVDGVGIGGLIRPGEVETRLLELPGVLQVRKAEIRAPGPGCYRQSGGDIRLPRRAIPALRELRLDQIPEEFSDR